VVSKSPFLAQVCAPYSIFKEQTRLGRTYLGFPTGALRSSRQPCINHLRSGFISAVSVDSTVYFLGHPHDSAFRKSWVDFAIGGKPTAQCEALFPGPTVSAFARASPVAEAFARVVRRSAVSQAEREYTRRNTQCQLNRQKKFSGRFCAAFAGAFEGHFLTNNSPNPRQPT
jgi:hypothetical protein